MLACLNEPSDASLVVKPVDTLACLSKLRKMCPEIHFASTKLVKTDTSLFNAPTSSTCFILYHINAPVFLETMSIT